jgi:hypothetical protein
MPWTAAANPSTGVPLAAAAIERPRGPRWLSLRGTSSVVMRFEPGKPER